MNGVGQIGLGAIRQAERRALAAASLIGEGDVDGLVDAHFELSRARIEMQIGVQLLRLEDETRGTLLDLFA